MSIRSICVAFTFAVVAIGCDPPLAPTMRELADREPEALVQFVRAHQPENYRERTFGDASDELTIMTIPIEAGMIFGDGSDGACNWDGVTTVKGDAPAAPNADDTVPAGTTAIYDITSWRFCSTATVSLHVAVHGFFPIFVDGNLQLDGAIINNGCSPSVANTACANTAGGSVAGLMNRGTGSESANTGVSCFFKPQEFDQSAFTNCADAAAASSPGANGTNGNPGQARGCGGSGGSVCNSATAGRAAPKSTVSLSAEGLGDVTMGDGYISYVNGLNGTGCAGTAGGSLAVIGINTSSASGGGGAWVDVHARTITGSGTLEARGGNAKAASSPSTSTCSGGGGGGGGGLVQVLVGSGSFPSTNVTGGSGATGQACVTPGACAGLHGGDGASGHDGLLETFRQ